jgi:hypothetical protein
VEDSAHVIFVLAHRRLLPFPNPVQTQLAPVKAATDGDDGPHSSGRLYRARQVPRPSVSSSAAVRLAVRAELLSLLLFPSPPPITNLLNHGLPATSSRRVCQTWFCHRLVRHRHRRQCRIHPLPTEISSVALGGSVTSVSDEFFAEAFHLLLVEASALPNFQLLLLGLTGLSIFFHSLHRASRVSMVLMVPSTVDGKAVGTTRPPIGVWYSRSLVIHFPHSSSPRCIIKLGTPGTIVGFDIDTSHFNGACAPSVDSISHALLQGMRLHKLQCRPSSSSLVRIPPTTTIE